MPSSSNHPDIHDEPNLGENIKRLRRARGWNLSALAKESGLPQSTLSKVESGQMSLNFKKLLRVAAALGTDVRNLFASPSEVAIADGAMARRIYERHTGLAIKYGQYSVRPLSIELKNRLMVPMLFEIKPVEENDIIMMNIIGERFGYVLEGPVEFRCQQYETIRLETGDSFYVDAAMPHAFVAASEAVAKIITVLTSSNLEYLELARDAALRGGTDASNRYKRRSERGSTASS